MTCTCASVTYGMTTYKPEISECISEIETLFVSRKYRCSNVSVFFFLVQVHKKCPTDSKMTSSTKTPSTTEPSTPIATSQRGFFSTFLPTNEQFTISKPLFRTVVKGKLHCWSPFLLGAD